MQLNAGCHLFGQGLSGILEEGGPIRVPGDVHQTEDLSPTFQPHQPVVGALHVIGQTEPKTVTDSDLFLNQQNDAMDVQHPKRSTWEVDGKRVGI